MDVIMRNISFLLLLMSVFSSPLMAAASCTQIPTTSCLTKLAAPDINAIPEDKREHWQWIYEQLLVDETLSIFHSGDMDAVWLSLDKIQSESARSDAVILISNSLAETGDEQLLEFIWEMDSDLTRLNLMLSVINVLLKQGHTEMAEKVYEDAQFVFRRLGNDELSDRLYKKMISAAKKFDDTLLLSTLADDYQKRMAGDADPNVLVRSGAYAQALQVVSETLQGKDRALRMQSIATGWLSNKGEPALLDSVASSSDQMFRAAAMYALGRHARSELNNPALAEEYLTKAEHYTDNLESVPARDELYDDIGREYRKLAKNDKLDLDGKMLAMAKKITDWEDAMSLQFEVVGIHMEAKDFARAEAIVQRESNPVLSGFYHYFLAEQARESGDASTAMVEIHEAQRLLQVTDNKELRYELSYDVGKFLHKLDDDDGAIKTFQEAALLALELPLKKRLKSLKSCARKLHELGAEQEAAAIFDMLVNEISASGNDAASMEAIIAFLPDLSGRGVSAQISQRLYEMESLLQGEALVKFYMKRAESSHDEGDREATLRFLNMALQQAGTEQLIKSCLDKGLDFFDNSETFPLRLSLLQHPSIPDLLLQKMLQKYVKEYLENDNFTKAEMMAELMPETDQFKALTEMLARAVDQHFEETSHRIYTQLQQQIREKSHLKVQLLELMVDDYEHALAIHYKDDVEKMITALDDRGAVLYFRALHVKWQARLSFIKRGEMRDKISKMMPQLATLSSTTERGWRAMIYLLLAAAY